MHKYYFYYNYYFLIFFEIKKFRLFSYNRLLTSNRDLNKKINKLLKETRP